MTPDVIALRLMMFIPVVLALTVHEWAHARVAYMLGDDTAENQGRMTLNPLVHLDPIGTVLLPLLGVPFGWAKPVPIEPSRFRPEVSMANGLLLSAAAGPISNLVMGGICGVGLRVLDATLGLAVPEAIPFMLERLTLINLALAVFNLLPIPPLDGSRIVDGLMPFAWRGVWDTISRFSVVLLIALLVAPQLFGFNIGAWVSAWASGLTGR